MVKKDKISLFQEMCKEAIGDIFTHRHNFNSKYTCEKMIQCIENYINKDDDSKHVKIKLSNNQFKAVMLKLGYTEKETNDTYIFNCTNKNDKLIALKIYQAKYREKNRDEYNEKMRALHKKKCAENPALMKARKQKYFNNYINKKVNKILAEKEKEKEDAKDEVV